MRLFFHRYKHFLRRFFLGIVLFLTTCLFLYNVHQTKFSHADTHNRPQQTITVYTSIPVEHASLLATEYEKLFKVRVDFVLLPADEILARVKKEGKNPKADFILTNEEILREGQKQGLFVPYVTEKTDNVSASLKNSDGAWVGVWIDPIVFAVNRDFLFTMPRIPQTFEELANYPNIRIALTDFFAADAFDNLFFSLINVYGEENVFSIFKAMHPKVTQYSKYLSTPVRMVGMGEVDFAIAMQSETLRYINEDYPIKLLYPKEGTAYYLTGIGFLKDDKKEAFAFADWLLGDDAAFALQKENFFVMPCNQNTLSYKMFAGKNCVLFDLSEAKRFSENEKNILLNRWLKEVRFK